MNPKPNWPAQNRRRCYLIRKDVKKGLCDDEKAELEALECIADERCRKMDLKHPEKPDEIQLTVERLKREGLWPQIMAVASVALGFMKKTMTPAALKQRREAQAKSVAARKLKLAQVSKLNNNA